MTSKQTETDQNQSVRIAARLPLSLLEAVRARDLPPEVLEGEDLPASLPRRLGLSEVVSAQIRRYREAARRAESVSMAEVDDLIRLVLRRPDAETLLRETGQQLAYAYLERLPRPARGVVGILPRRMALPMAARAGRRLLRPLAGTREVERRRGEPGVCIRGGITARVDETGMACALYSAALGTLSEAYGRVHVEVRHDHCAARGDDACEWIFVEEQ